MFDRWLSDEMRRQLRSPNVILEDMFLGIRVEAFSGSPRKQVLSTPKFLLFDMGVRHAAADMPFDRATVLGNPGPLFETWMGLELWRRLQYLHRGRLSYLRTRGGAEVDFIVEVGSRFVPVEAKWTENPTRADARHVVAFLADHPKQARRGFIVCRCARPMQLDKQVLAIPWWML